MVRGRRDQRESSSVCNRTDLRKDGKKEVEAKNLILNYPIELSKPWWFCSREAEEGFFSPPKR
jgi:hypothetical protein